MPTFKLTVAYDGAGFVGWQRQASGLSIQGVLETALAELAGGPVAVAGAGRTDAGVHAIGQTASFSIDRDIDGATLVRALNANLPETVRVASAVEMPSGFHARFDARSKVYRYRLWNGAVLSPFKRAYSWHVPLPALDIDAMSAAALLVEGQHDFAAFQASGADTQDTHRTIISSRMIGVSEPDVPAGLTDGSPGIAAFGSLIVYEIRADGFLRHMVRTIVGTLLDVGRQRRPSDWVREVLASRDRARAGRTAPPEGLFLMRVDYE